MRRNQDPSLIGYFGDLKSSRIEFANFMIEADGKFITDSESGRVFLTSDRLVRGDLNQDFTIRDNGF